MTSLDTDLLIIGGGLAGLAAAITAERSGLKALVIERESEPGGLARSVRADGFTFDFSGHLLHLARPETRSLIASVTDTDDWNELERRSTILFRDKFVPYPFQLHLAHTPPDVREDCLRHLPKVPAFFDSDPDKVVFGDWIRGTLGEGIGRHFMVPYNEKLSTARVDEMTCEWLGRFVPQPSLDEIRQGALSRRRIDTGYNARFLYPKRGGIDLLPKAMAAHVPHLLVGTTVTEIVADERVARLSTGDVVRYRLGVVSSAPLGQTARLLEPEPSWSSAADRLRANQVTCVNLGVRAIGERFADLQWVYLPEREFTAYRAGFYKRFSDRMTPPGRESVYVEIAHDGTLDEASLCDTAVTDLLRAGILSTPADVEVVVPLRMPNAYVIHDHETSAVRDSLITHLAKRDIHMVGRYGLWEYASMEDALLQGICAVRNLGSTGAKSVR